MSSLKEEWVNLMKLRESGYMDQAKKEEIRSRIFNNFYSQTPAVTVEVPNFSQISIKSEYEKMRTEFLSTVSTEYRPKTPEIPKKFEFGLKNVTPPPSQHKLNRVDLKSDDIWSIKDSSFQGKPNEYIPDQFTLHSIADLNSGFVRPASANKEINIFADISPITRYLSMISVDDEEKYLKETSRHQTGLFSLLHIVHEEVCELEKVEWSEAKKFANGIIFKTEVNKALIPKVVVKDLSIASESKLVASQCLSEPPLLLDGSLRIPKLQVSNSNTTLHKSFNEVSIIEKDLLDMMDEIKDDKHNTSLSKIKTLLDRTQRRLENEGELTNSIQVRVIYQFLLEYVKSQENKAKVVENKKPVQPRPTQKKKTPIRTSTLAKIESTSSINSSRSSKWIGGSKFQADFEDESDWVSANPEKKKKETRNDKLYKLSMKANK